MTPRAYWDRDEGLWEERPGSDAVRPVISFGEDGHVDYLVGPGNEAYWQRALVERVYGPLVAVA
jgi:hypothetical protein